MANQGRCPTCGRFVKQNEVYCETDLRSLCPVEAWRGWRVELSRTWDWVCERFWRFWVWLLWPLERRQLHREPPSDSSVWNWVAGNAYYSWEARRCKSWGLSWPPPEEPEVKL